MPTVNTILRYPGGKSKLSSFISSLIETNNLNDAIYVEPYAGGAGIAVNLLFNEWIREVIINDFDIHIYSFWKSILDDTERILQLIKDKKVSVSEWKKQKYIFLNPKEYSRTEVGFSTFYLNRCNRSGVLTGGVIGGYKQLGNYKIDARFNKDNLSRRIERIALYSNRIKVYKKDALTLLKNINDKKQKYFIYLDPPYYHKSDDLYYNIYKESDHKKLSVFLKKEKNFFWVLSYDNCKEIRTLYTKNKKRNFSINYSLNKKTEGHELMIFDKKIKITKSSLKNLVNN